jgi:hypothetical protein
MRHVKQTATSAHQKRWTLTVDDVAALALTGAGVTLAMVAEL